MLAGHRQVFGLAGFGLSYSSPLPSSLENQCLVTTFVPAYRCGTVPDSHRIPYIDSERRLARAKIESNPDLGGNQGKCGNCGTASEFLENNAKLRIILLIKSTP